MVRLSRVGLALTSGFLLGAFQSDQRFNPADPPQLWYRYGDTVGGDDGFFGSSLTGVGDQNNDGYDDVLIANKHEKKVFLYLGGSPMDTLPALTLQRGEPFFGFFVSNFGDVNGDAITDFAISSFDVATYFYLGGTMDTSVSLILPSYARLSGAGDVNGDAYDDILASDVTWNEYKGKAWLYFGGNPMDTIPDWSVVGDSARYWFGVSLGGGGDLNGDGYSDFAIAGFRALQPGGPAYIKVFLGGESVDTIPDLIIDESQLSNISEKVWLVNDLNGDSYDELATVSGSDTGLYIFYGRDFLAALPDLVLRGSGFSAPVDLRVASIGDINADGYNDVLTGNPSAWNRLGEVLLYLGHPNMSGEFDVGWTGFLGPWVGAGQAVGWCGDVNGDSLNDILFSSYDPNWPTRNGRVDIFGGDTSLVVSVDEQGPHDGVPEAFELKQNYPNPFNPTTTIRYDLPINGRVTLKIYDILGEEVMTLVDKFIPAGYHHANVDASKLSSGVYFCRLVVRGANPIESGRFLNVKKMLLLK